MRFCDFVVALCASMALGCAYASVERDAIRPAGDISSSADVRVLVPEDGIYGEDVYRGSGHSVASRTLSAVRDQFPLAQLIETSDEAVALQRARNAGVDYIVSPSILHWEDRATPWSGFRDKVTVEVRLLRVSPPNVLSTVIFESRNNSITFIDGRPQDLLDDDYAGAVRSLF